MWLTCMHCNGLANSCLLQVSCELMIHFNKGAIASYNYSVLWRKQLMILKIEFVVCKNSTGYRDVA